MPEIVEVQLQTEGLKETIVGDKFVGVEYYDKADKILRPISEFEFSNEVLNLEILSVIRRGKYIVIVLEDGTLITSHLAMTGRWLLNVPEEKVGHTRIKFLLKSGRELRYSDVRVFGRIRLEESLDKKIYDKGLDVLNASEEQIAVRLYYAKKLKPNMSIKMLLTEQNLLCGLGNVYANEILWDAGVYPGKPLGELDEEKLNLLAFTIKYVLNQGYADGGLSFKDYYHVDGTKGKAQENLEVYKNQFCNVCKSNILKSDEYDGRATYYCPKCQV